MFCVNQTSCRTEHIEQAQKRDAKIASSEAIPVPDQVAAEPLQIPGITYRNINFNGSAYSKMLIKQLSWSQFSKLVWLMAVGKRTEAISILGVNVMTERGLIGLGEDSLDVCTKEVTEFFDILADPESYPVMVHCTQGKDRTGLTVLLSLLLLEVPLEAAEYDYMITQSQLTNERAGRIKEINSIGLPDSFADCDPDFVKEVDKHIRDKYGGIRQYLLQAGVTPEHLQSVQKNLATSVAIP